MDYNHYSGETLTANAWLVQNLESQQIANHPRSPISYHAIQRRHPETRGISVLLRVSLRRNRRINIFSHPFSYFRRFLCFRAYLILTFQIRMKCSKRKSRGRFKSGWNASFMRFDFALRGRSPFYSYFHFSFFDPEACFPHLTGCRLFGACTAVIFLHR